MRVETLNLPIWRSGASQAPYQMTVYHQEGDQVIEGLLTAADGTWYPVIRGVPSFLRGVLCPDFSGFCRRHGLAREQGLAERPPTAEHAQTVDTFSDKWRRFRNYGLEPSHQEFLFEWYCKKLGVADVEALKAFYRGKQRILEVGPGSGFNSRFMAENCGGHVWAADISEAAFTAFENTRKLPNCHVVQSDLMELPFDDASFDFIMADGVLHHTPDTRAAVAALVRKLEPGGQFFFYVYKKMGPARQFCDRYIREAFSRLDNEACYAACEGLTELGRELSRVHTTITLKHGIPILGIAPGTHDVQRLLYYHFVKCFWNDAFDEETNNMVNFDWYHPSYAWQHTEDEVAGWLQDLGIREFEFHPANPNGISVLLRRPQ